jgi:hypothetical protein
LLTSNAERDDAKPSQKGNLVEHFPGPKKLTGDPHRARPGGVHTYGTAGGDLSYRFGRFGPGLDRLASLV